MARATSSFPVPVSPNNRTEARLWLTMEMSLWRRRIGAETPISPSNPACALDGARGGIAQFSIRFRIRWPAPIWGRYIFNNLYLCNTVEYVRRYVPKYIIGASYRGD